MSKRQFRHFGRGRPQELRARARVFPTKFERMEHEKKARGKVSVAEIKGIKELKREILEKLLAIGHSVEFEVAFNNDTEKTQESIDKVRTELDKIYDMIDSFDVDVKDEAISIQETFETVWKECPEFKVSLYNALTRQKELIFKILGIKYQPVRSVEELRRLLEGEGEKKEKG